MKKIVLTLAFIGLLSAGSAFAETSNTAVTTKASPVATSQLLNVKAAPQLSYKYTLRPGMANQKVSSLQAVLKEKGYYHANIDGKYGPMTRAAVKRFQAAKNLVADGIAGIKTYSAFSAHTNASSGAVPSLSTDSNTNPDVADTVCTLDYSPVCGQKIINCIKAPCPQPEPQTYGNSCMAKAAGAMIIHKGSCDTVDADDGTDDTAISDSAKRKRIEMLENFIKRLENRIDELKEKIEVIKESL